MNPEVTKITIKIGEAEIALKPEEARGLRDVLNELLGGKTIEIRTDHIMERHPWNPWAPWWDVTYTTPEKPTVTWCAASSSPPVISIGG